MLAEMDRVRAKYEQELEARFAAARGFVDAILALKTHARRSSFRCGPRSIIQGRTLAYRCCLTALPNEVDR